MDLAIWVLTFRRGREFLVPANTFMMFSVKLQTTFKNKYEPIRKEKKNKKVVV